MEWLKDFADTPDHPLGLAILFLAAIIEYVFPPFPGDLVTLGGAVLVGRYDWSFPIVFTVVNLGSAVGAAVDFLFGVKLHAWREGKDRKVDRALRGILDGFRRWGIWLIVANRFMPGIRAFFFVAAGMAGFSFWPVVGLAVVSAALWNLMLVGVGAWVGAEFDTLARFVRNYQFAAWIAIAVAALAIAIVVLGRRRRAAKP